MSDEQEIGLSAEEKLRWRRKVQMLDEHLSTIRSASQTSAKKGSPRRDQGSGRGLLRALLSKTPKPSAPVPLLATQSDEA